MKVKPQVKAVLFSHMPHCSSLFITKIVEFAISLKTDRHTNYLAQRCVAMLNTAKYCHCRINGVHSTRVLGISNRKDVRKRWQFFSYVCRNRRLRAVHRRIEGETVDRRNAKICKSCQIVFMACIIFDLYIYSSGVTNISSILVRNVTRYNLFISLLLYNFII